MYWKSPPLEEAYTYIVFVLVPFVYFMYDCAMFLLTSDRLLMAVTGASYRNYTNIGKTKIALTLIWSIGILCLLTITPLYFASGLRLLAVIKVVTSYFAIITSLTNLFVAVAAYVAMFMQLWKSNRRLTTASPASLWTLFRTSRFYTAVLLITSYGDPMAEEGFSYAMFAMIFSDTCDVFIYVFKYPRVRKLLLLKLASLFPCCRRRVGVTQRDIVLQTIGRASPGPEFIYCVR